MLKSPLITIKCNTDFFDHKQEYLHDGYDKIIYTGMIDQFFNYCYGALAYRSLKFKHEIKNVSNYQGNAVVNYTSADVPFTRVIEHKWFEHGRGDCHKTVITHEYPQKWNRDRDHIILLMIVRIEFCIQNMFNYRIKESITSFLVDV